MEILSGTAKLTQQVGGKGYFGEIELEAIIDEGERSLAIEFVANGADQWREAAIVGVRNALSQLPSKVTYGKTVTVRIKSLNWQTADTTDMVVVFVAAKAVFNLFDAQPRQSPEFMASFGAFVFPK